MDAAQKLYKNTGILLFVALVLAAPAWAQTPTLLLSSNSVTLNQSTLFASVSVSSSVAGTPITYNAAITSIDAPGNWLRLTEPASHTTPDSVGVQIAQASSIPGTYTAKVTLTPTAPTGLSPVTITVTWLNGSGGGGGGGTTIILDKTTSTIVTTPGNLNFDNISVTTTSATGIGLGVVTATTTCTGTNWLSATLNNFIVTAAVPATVNIKGDATGISGNTTCNGTVTVTPGTGTAVVITVTLTVGSGSGGGSLTVTPASFTLNYNSGGTFPTQALTLSYSGSSTTLSATADTNWLLINNNSPFFFLPSTPLTVSLSPAVQSLTDGPHVGNITFDDGLNNTAVVTVTVNVNNGTSAGLTVTPASLSFSAAVGGAAQSKSLNATSNTGGTFSAATSVNTSVNWLSASTTSTNLGANTTGSVTVTVTPGSLGNGTYNGNVNVTIGSQAQSIPVTFTVGSGGGGGTGTGIVAPNAISVAWQALTDPAFVNHPEITIAGTAGNWTSSVTTAQGGNWLSLSPDSGSNIPAQAVVVVSPAGLTPGTYTGTITVNTPSGSQNVTITLSVTSGANLNSRPGSLVFNYQTGTTIPAAQAVFFSTSDVGLNNSLDITGSVTSSVPWITTTVSQKSMLVSVDPTGLGGGVYTGSITIAPLSVGPLTLPVVLVVDGGTGGGSGALTFLPSSVSFSAPAGSNPASQTISVGASNQARFSVTSNAPWLFVTPNSGTAPTSVTVSVVSSSFAAGTSLSGVLSFNSNGVIQTVPVSLTVTGSGGGTSGNVTVSSSGLNFSSVAPAGTLAVQGLTVSSASGIPGVGFVLQVTTSSGGSWLSTSPGPGVQLSTQTTVSVNVNATGLAAGTYQGNIRITPTGGSVVDVPVTLTLTSPATVSATPTNLTFGYRAGGATPAPQTISVTGGSALPFTASASSNASWLSVSPSAGTTPATVTASVNASALSAGTYLGTITIAGATAGTGSTTINVTLTVTVPLPTISRLGNAASYAGGNIAPGEIIAIFGTDLGPVQPVGLALDNTGKVATTLAGVQVTVKGYPAPLTYVSNSQIGAVVPYELAQFTAADVLVKYLGQSSNGIAVNVVTTTPGVFTANSSGTGPGAISNQNGSPNGPSNPANRGDTIVVYVTGEGQTSPAGVTGKVTTVSATPPLTPSPLLPISVLIGGQPANFSFAGEAPGFVSGVMQLNVTVPLSAGTGAQSIVVSVGGNSSQNGVTVALQ